MLTWLLNSVGKSSEERYQTFREATEDACWSFVIACLSWLMETYEPDALTGEAHLIVADLYMALADQIHEDAKRAVASAHRALEEDAA